MKELVGSVFGIALIVGGLAVAFDWGRVWSRPTVMQYGFLELFNRHNGDQGQFPRDMRTLGRLSGGLLVMFGVYALVLVFAVWV